MEGGSSVGHPKANGKVESIIRVGLGGAIDSLYILCAQLQMRCKPKILLTCGH